MDSLKNLLPGSAKKNITWSDLPESADGPTLTRVAEGKTRISINPNTANVREPTSQDSPQSARFIGKLFSYFKATNTLPIDDAALKRPVFTKDTTLGEVKSLTIAELSERLENMSRTTYNENKMTWLKSDFKSIRSIPRGPLLLPALANPRASQFSQADSKGQAKELEADIYLLQAKASWLARDYQSMAAYTQKALKASEDNCFPAYTAKVCFYIAVSYIGLRDFPTGQAFLDLARECKGIYREGELIDWVQQETDLLRDRVANQDPNLKIPKSKKQSIYTAGSRRKRSISNPSQLAASQWWQSRTEQDSGTSSSRDFSTGLSSAASMASRNSFVGNVADLGAELGGLLGSDLEEDEKE